MKSDNLYSECMQYYELEMQSCKKSSLINSFYGYIFKLAAATNK